MLELNLFASLRATRPALRAITKRGDGVIVNRTGITQMRRSASVDALHDLSFKGVTLSISRGGPMLDPDDLAAG